MLYFIPNIETPTDDNIKACLGSVTDEGQIESVSANKGPGGSPGVVVYLGGQGEGGMNHAPTVGFYPDKQTWVESNNGAYWIGWETDTPPEPSDLVKPSPIDGHRVTLADGNEWLIPVARIFPQGSALPQALILGPDGELISEGLPKYASLSASADRVWSDFQRSIDGGERPESEKALTIKDQFSIAIEAISTNYSVGKWEASALRLFTTENVVKVLETLIDIPTLLEVAKAQGEALKKKDPANTRDGNITNGGNPGDAPLTSPPTPMPTGLVKGGR